MRQLVLPFLAAALLLASCAETAPRQPGDHSQSLMTGTTAERNAFIARVLADESDRVHQINMQNLSLEIALEYLTNHLKIDAHVDWNALAAQGISRDDAKTTLILFDATYADGLRAILWQLHPRTGSIGCTIEGGKLLIRPQPASALPETAAQKLTNAQIRQKLTEMLDAPPSLLQSHPAASQFYALGFAKKLSIVVDWDELARAGVKPDLAVSVNPAASQTGAYLQVLVNSLALNGPAVGYDIRHGMIRVSTQARLDAQHALERTLPP